MATYVHIWISEERALFQYEYYQERNKKTTYVSNLHHVTLSTTTPQMEQLTPLQRNRSKLPPNGISNSIME